MKKKEVKIKLHSFCVEPKIKKTKWKIIEGDPIVIIDPSVKKYIKESYKKFVLNKFKEIENKILYGNKKERGQKTKKTC